MKSVTANRVIVFDDDADVRACWKLLVQQEAVQDLYLFESWEDFLRRGSASLVRDAIVFIDNNFASVGSLYDGTDIAEAVKREGARKLYSISSDPEAARARPDLFNGVLATKMPFNLGELLD